jgi:hypothetical protein
MISRPSLRGRLSSSDCLIWIGSKKEELAMVISTLANPHPIGLQQVCLRLFQTRRTHLLRRDPRLGCHHSPGTTGHFGIRLSHLCRRHYSLRLRACHRLFQTKMICRPKRDPRFCCHYIPSTRTVSEHAIGGAVSTKISRPESPSAT